MERTLSIVLVALGLCVSPPFAAAQEEAEIVLFYVARGDAAQGGQPEAEVFEPLTVAAERLAVIQSLGESIAAAWEHLGQLEHGAAIARLARARQQAEANADIPGISSWLAELEAMTAVTASQIAGDPWALLTDQSLERMASLDGRRLLRPGEAPPQLVARADAARQRVRAAPQSAFRLSANADGAVAFVDGERVGALPARIEVGAGRHVLRVVAPGYRAFGQVLDVDSGARAAMRVRLSREATAERRVAVESAPTLAEARAHLRPGDQLTWVEAEGERGIVAVCFVTGCASPQRNEDEGEGVFEPSLWLTGGETMNEAEFETAWADARSWLTWVEPPPPEPTRWYQHWGVWVGIGTAVLVGVAASARALTPEPETRFQTTIRFDDL